MRSFALLGIRRVFDSLHMKLLILLLALVLTGTTLADDTKPILV